MLLEFTDVELCFISSPFCSNDNEYNKNAIDINILTCNTE